jgi:hypothetical protein
MQPRFGDGNKAYFGQKKGLISAVQAESNGMGIFYQNYGYFNILST